MSKPRILLQTYAFRPVWGGVARSVEMLHHYLTPHASVRLATSNRVELDPRHIFWIPPWQSSGLRGCHRFPFLTPHHRWHRLSFLPYLAYLHWFRPQVVHLHFVNVDAHYTLRAQRRLGFRLLTTCHGSDVHVHSRRPQGREFLLQVLRQSSRVTVVSEELRARLLELAPDLAVEVIPNAAVTAAPGRRSPFVLFAGRLSAQKDPMLLLEAFAEWNKPGWSLVYAGQGELHARLLERAHQLGIAGQVKLVGQLAFPALQSLMARAAALVLPSQSGEGCPHVVLEAMACGTPVIASRVGGVPELVQGAGLLFEAGNRQQLVQRLQDSLADPGLSLAGRERAASYSPAKTLGRYLEIYQELA